MTLYTEAGRSKTSSFLLISVFMLFVIAAGWFIGRAYDIVWLLPVAVAIAIVQSWVSYYYSDKIALMIARARPVARAENPVLHRIVENLSITAGLPQPAVYVIDDSAPNAFATGRDPAHASLAVTSGLLEKLEKPELEGVIAHELSHVGNYDIRFMSIVVVLVGVITMISDWALRSMWYRGRSRDSGDGQAQLIILVVGLVLAILSPLIATLIQLAISRKREFLADATGALLTRYPQGLASALRKIAADPEPLEVANKGTAHLYFENPLKGEDGRQSWLQKIFSTHPPVEERIKALLQGGGEQSS